jgi:hypothetical protein
MGNWNITIRGVGIHHNGKSQPDDANRMAAEFVKKLKAAGHSVSSASITFGAEDNITDADSYLGIYAPPPPEQPPVDNAHVAPGAEPFPAPPADGSSST